MRISQVLTAAAGLLGTTHGLNILITNDDGFGTANIRELYNQMKSLGHNCYIVASVSSQPDGQFREGFTTHPTLTADGDWGLVKAGAPSLGFDPADNHIWYYNGTAAAQVVIALDYILPTYGKIASPDLVISGPNAAATSDFFLQSFSGTMSATYVAIERDIPAMVFWTGNTVPIPYTWLNTSTKTGLQDPSTITARLASSLVEAFITKAAGGRVLPQGYGVTVKLPYITSATSEQCTNPPFVLQRMSAGEVGAKATYNAKTGLFTQIHGASSGINNLFADDIDESIEAANSTCVSSVTVFAVKYDTTYHRECFNVTDVTAIIPVVVQINGSVPVPDGLGPNASVSSNVSQSPPDGPSPQSHPPAIISMGSAAQWSSSAIMLGLAIWGFTY
ncbi:putative acid phosphatase [Cladorrhinum sp. PSN259]|nr:putative acid phosphatase [Cladorrhinum sp. PSN259]